MRDFFHNPAGRTILIPVVLIGEDGEDWDVRIHYTVEDTGTDLRRNLSALVDWIEDAVTRRRIDFAGLSASNKKLVYEAGAAEL